MKIMSEILKDAALLEKYNAKVTKQTKKEMTIELNNSNWFNVFYFKIPPEFGKEDEIILSSNLEFFGYKPFKRHWKVNEDIFSFIKECVFPTLSFLNGYFNYSMEEICSSISEKLEKEKIQYTFEKRLFSFFYWNTEYAKKDLLEYNGVVYSFPTDKKNVKIFIQLSKFIYIEIENCDKEKTVFPWYFFVDPHTSGKNSLDMLFQNLFKYILQQ